MLRCQAGEQGAFDDLIAEFERPLFYYAVKLVGSQDTALDVLQEVWIRAMRGIRKLKDPSAVRAWRYRLVHGIVVDEIRRDRSRERAEDTHSAISEDGQHTRFGAADAAAVNQALDRLEPRHRELLVLYFLEDFSLAGRGRGLFVGGCDGGWPVRHGGGGYRGLFRCCGSEGVDGPRVRAR